MSFQQETDDRKPGSGNVKPKYHGTPIYEEFESGSRKRLCDPAEFGIAAPENSSATAPTPGADETLAATPRRPHFPTIYEENHGGVQRKIISIEELHARHG